MEAPLQKAVALRRLRTVLDCARFNLDKNIDEKNGENDDESADQQQLKKRQKLLSALEQDPLKWSKSNNGRNIPADNKKLVQTLRGLLPESFISSKWGRYEEKCWYLCDELQKTLLELRTKSSSIDDTSSSENDILFLRYQIYTIKQSIRKLLEKIIEEGRNHTRYPHLAITIENNKLDDNVSDVTIEDIVCSMCGESDLPDNDIFLCDKKGCCRAFHQKCLDPVINTQVANAAENWFCWECETLTNCLIWARKASGAPKKIFDVERMLAYLQKDADEWVGKYYDSQYSPDDLVEAKIVHHEKDLLGDTSGESNESFDV